MSFADDVRWLQRFAGVPEDGMFGPITAATLRGKLDTPAPRRVKLCIDAGHGQDNRNPGTYDPGAVGGGLEEADVALEYALTLRAAAAGRGVECWLTRATKFEPCPLATRASRARQTGCTHLVSVHLNHADDSQAHGIETLYRDDEPFAMRLQSRLVPATGLRDRGAKRRTDLAVLKFNGIAALIELGFISNAADRARLIEPPTMKAVANAVLDAI